MATVSETGWAARALETEDDGGVQNYTLRQLEYFVAVAEAGTVTGAAQTLHLSQSALSGALADLERALGVQLFARHHARGVTLTPAGDALLIEARALLVKAADLADSAQDLVSGLGGSFMFGCFSVLAPYLVPAVLGMATQEVPDLSVQPVELGIDDLASAVVGGEFEIAVSYDLGLTPGITVEVLGEVAPHVVLASDHPLAGAAEIRLAQLSEEPLVLLDLPHSRDYFHQVFTAGGVRPKVRYRTMSAETARSVAARGLAYSILNMRPVPMETSDGQPFVTVPIADDVPALRIVLLTNGDAELTRRAAVLSDLIRRAVHSIG